MTNTLSIIPNTLPVSADGLQAYMQRINAIPMLTAEEEKDLATRFQAQGDLLAAQQLVLSHLRFVARIAKGYSGYGLGVADLIQEGTIGLMKAVKRYDPAVGVRLVSFAVHWIKSEIHEYVIRNWRIVKVATTKAQRKLFFNLRTAKKRLGWFSAEEVKAVALDLGVSTKEVLEMESRLNGQDHTFDYPDTDEEACLSSAPAYYLAAPCESEPAYAVIENNQEADDSERLQQAMQLLDPRSHDIVSKRWLGEEKASLKELAEKHDISIERVRQLEKAAMQKLHANLAQA